MAVKNGGMLRKWLTMTPMVLLGLILLTSGIGKLIAGSIAGETEFLDVLLKSFWGPLMSSLISTLLPPAEVVLGALLILRVYPRLAAACSIPLYLGFMANNVYALSKGMDKFPQCGYCFGVFEKLLGSPTPLQSFTIDIVMLVFAVVVICFFPGKFFGFKPWFWPFKGGKKVKADEKTVA
jgi:hypothetical protein